MKTRSRVLAVFQILLVAGTLMPVFAADQKRPLTEIPFRSEFRGIAFVAGLVNGERPVQFLLDTGGGGSIVDREIAEGLGMKVAPGQASVSGNKALDVGVVQGALLQVGKVAFRARVLATPLQSLAPVFGHRMDGIVGGNFIREFVVEFDYERNVVRLFRAAGYKFQGHAAVLPLSIIEGIPFLSLEVSLPNGKRVRGRFLIDTGGGGMAVHIYRSFAEREKLLDDLGKVAEETGQGIGGTRQRIATRARALSIGPYRLLRPPVAFPDDVSGTRTEQQAVGSIGIEVLRRFKVTFDYSRMLLYLEPNHRFKEKFVYDSSGLRLRADPPSFHSFYVSEVLDGSPAAHAGLQPHDVLVQVDGRDTSGTELEAVRNMLYEPGQSHRIAVDRDGEKIELVLQTRDILP